MFGLRWPPIQSRQSPERRRATHLQWQSISTSGRSTACAWRGLREIDGFDWYAARPDLLRQRPRRLAGRIVRAPEHLSRALFLRGRTSRSSSIAFSKPGRRETEIVGDRSPNGARRSRQAEEMACRWSLHRPGEVSRSILNSSEEA